MARRAQRNIVSLLLVAFVSVRGVASKSFAITNNCEYTVWPGILSSAGSAGMDSTGFVLAPGESRTMSVPAGWSGRLWGRTLCSTDSDGKFTCVTGDCGSGRQDCAGGGAAPPATLAEFTMDGSGGMDFYDVSLVDGYNLPMLVAPQGAASGGNCAPTGCMVDLNGACPADLRVASASAGSGGVACKSACEAFGSAQYCCSGEYGNPDTCRPSAYSQFFKNACPRAYSYAYDDATSTFTCAGGDTSYAITFCASTTRSMASSNRAHPFALRSILEKEKLNGTNYSDWVRNLRIVLRADKKENVLDTPIPEEPAINAAAAVKTAYKKACDDSLEISCLMLACMEPDLQKQFEDQEAYDMIMALKDMFQTQARTERFNVSKTFLECKLTEGAPVGPHVIKMVGYSQTLDKLGFPIGQELATDFILASLPPSYGHFISNYHMHGVEKGLNELCGMLKTAESDIKKCAGPSHVMAVQNKSSFKKKGRKPWAKNKGKVKDMISKPTPKPNAGPGAETVCFYCKETGHWKRNCKKYMDSEECKKNAGSKTSTHGANKK